MGKMRVCYFGTYRKEYSRNQIMIAGLREVGVEVLECHEELWRNVEDRIQAVTGGLLQPTFWWHLTRTYLLLIYRFFKTGDFDIMIVGYPGQLDVFLARILCWLYRKPLVWDIFMSIYLISLERALDKTNSFTIQCLRWIEKIACYLPDMLIIDTDEYRKWFIDNYRIPISSIKLVPTGADNRIFQPKSRFSNSDGIFRVLYYGSFIPNHGITTIMEAANLLQNNPNIHFELIGEGPEKKMVKQFIEQMGLKNIILIDWLEQTELVKYISNADICLGVFGVTPQSMMTIQNKIYECLAMAKPIITGDSTALRSILEHGKHAWLIERANPRALATAINKLKINKSLRQQLALNGYDLFQTNFAISNIGTTLFEQLQQVI